MVELNGRTFLTPLAVALVLVETTDLLFAVDSIPAIFAVTADPFLVFTSNVFAILCLRSLYFGLAGLIQRFRYLKVSLALVLSIVGVKMLAGKWIKLWLGEESNHCAPGRDLRGPARRRRRELACGPARGASVRGVPARAERLISACCSADSQSPVAWPSTKY